MWTTNLVKIIQPIEKKGIDYEKENSVNSRDVINNNINGMQKR